MRVCLRFTACGSVLLAVGSVSSDKQAILLSLLNLHAEPKFPVIGLVGKIGYQDFVIVFNITNEIRGITCTYCELACC